jgi:hypothetical protein
MQKKVGKEGKCHKDTLEGAAQCRALAKHV